MAGKFQEIPGYEMLSELGEGGMATVYLAIQHSLDRKVAIKVMRRELRVSNGPMPEFERRFLLEGRTMAKLPHRNIVAVYDIVTRDDIAYISMEYLEGGTLSERMREGVSLGEAIGIVVQLANGLEFAHRNGVIHRDLKPSNVMFRDPTTPVLTDFGIAKQSDVMASRITQTGLVLGTPTYMSPEQASGRETDGRSDQYSLGILFYELLTGQPPFTGDNPMNVLMGHALQPPPPLPADLAPLQPVFDRMLAKTPADRFKNLQDFTRALRTIVVGNDTLAKKLGDITASSTSERLRALGFSGELTGGDSGFALDLLRMPRTDPSLRNATSGVQRALRQRPRLFAAIAAGLGALLIGGVLWLAFAPRQLSQDEQVLVRTLLREADRFVESGALLDPPGENAFEDVQKVLQKDPANARALELLQQIGDKVRAQAEAALAAGNLEDAGERANQALLVVPDDDAVQALVKRIGDEQAARTRAQRVTELLAKADEAEKRGRRNGPDGAYALLRNALALAPDNAGALQRLKVITDAEFRRVRDLLKLNRADEAAQAHAALKADFGSDAAFIALGEDIVRAQGEATRTRQVAERLARAQAAFAAGRISEPLGDNAFELYEQARQLDEKSGAVAAFRKTLTDRLITDARAARERGDFVATLDRAELALRIDPALAGAKAIRDDAESKLDARLIRIAGLLNNARIAITAGRPLPPARDNARDILDALLREDPANADARTLYSALPQLTAEAVRAALARDDLDAATALATAGTAAYADDAALASLAGDVRQRVLARDATRALQEREQRIAGLLQQRPLSADDAANVARDILALREARIASAERYEQQLADVLADDVRTANDATVADASLAAIRATTAALANSRVLAAIYPEAEARVVALQKQRAEQLEAQKGTLVINAMPWGYVDQVLDAARKPIELPQERSTPLQLNLPAGSYYVTLRHPNSNKTVSAFARVQARQRSQTSGSFPSLGTDEYLRNAGF
ncbi:MAG TPA: serine/threonine-protein kinase [Dokdonella sp.]|uniref:serine/threonine-protein kinase n=1 Tax=Dokdonella sp. TaxID=2291710 RepID=UPI0025C11E9E|nr:serine/threonine-protein kinase [Dokdonella sp.]MBX3690918.1 serine/threonine protein kinase [Dokdonella sp.]HNR91179.1 serine/threonine-protein kinase [Dokdonella sp.]